MLSALIEIVNFIGSIIQFVIQMVESLLTFVLVLGRAVVSIPAYYSYVPTFLLGFVTVSITISVVLLLAGRN